eukprot:SAG31_NODE_387_length_16403_cov_5.062071_11_plen_115_part_00
MSLTLIFGRDSNVMCLGGANPAFFKLKPEAEYDSWLTVGLTDGNSKNQISKIGIDFEKWDLQVSALACLDPFVEVSLKRRIGTDDPFKCVDTSACRRWGSVLDGSRRRPAFRKH